mmetsp:Transcript_29409/g.66580  ORF Transcript_29409/g.66580 Transcript_29409/m.66580 type:complete len:85 (-) Transcript_29409:624-878(-)
MSPDGGDFCPGVCHTAKELRKELWEFGKRPDGLRRRGASLVWTQKLTPEAKERVDAPKQQAGTRVDECFRRKKAAFNEQVDGGL